MYMVEREHTFLTNPEFKSKLYSVLAICTKANYLSFPNYSFKI